MNNSTPSTVQADLAPQTHIRFFLCAILLLIATLSWSQGIIPLPHLPGQLLDAPQQFTTNLISVTTSGSTAVDGAITVLDPGFSNSIDASDAIKITKPQENLGEVRDGKVLVIEARQPVVSRDTIFYKMWNLKQQQYQLEFYAINMNKPGLSAVLIDRYLLTTTPISLSTAPILYPFMVSADAGSFAEDRFIIILVQADAGPLPVNFISISASQRNSGTQVSWKVAGERGIQNYLIERSTNGKNFTAVGIVTATGYSNNDRVYVFNDATAQSGTYFYRVKSNGIDGELKISSIVKLTIGGTKSFVLITPNPVEGNAIHLQMTNKQKGNYDIRLIGLNGVLLLSRSINHAGGSSVISIDVPGSIAPGTYHLQVIDSNGEKQAQTLLLK